jgi:hypothetical protein
MSVAVLAVCSSRGFADPAMSAFNTKDCPERTTVLPWCAPKLSAEGWKLKYKSESSPQLMDVRWVYEIRQREGATVACIFEGSRSGIRVNHCRALDEVRDP